jgi:hypothetical protein
MRAYRTKDEVAVAAIARKLVKVLICVERFGCADVADVFTECMVQVRAISAIDKQYSHLSLVQIAEMRAALAALEFVYCGEGASS